MQECSRCVCLCVIEKSVPEDRLSDMTQISGKMFTESMFVNFGGPAGGEAPGKVLRPKIEISRELSRVPSDS